MSRYRIEFDKRVKKDFKRITPSDTEKIKIAIAKLAKNPYPIDAKKLKGKDELFRVRVGNYRVIYTVEDEILLVLVVRVGHRREIYRSI